MRAYAIGDIHGQLGLLKAAHDRIATDSVRHGPAPVVHVGDLVDRGPDSRGVIDFLMQGIAAGQDWTVLKGNHDRLFTRFLHDPFDQDPGLRSEFTWLHPRLGGAETLASYGVRSAADRRAALVQADAVQLVPQAHRSFLEGLPAWHRIGEVLFVHAGIRPGIPIESQTETDLIWIRQPFLDDPRDHGPLIVHGHTALDAPTHHGNRVNIDSSAGYGGPLTAIALEGREVFLLTDAGRVPLRPMI
ncbi:serine/threonine protein phosphatase [Rhodobacter sp. Har01]|uniref:metallophosphoesterase family protein n=1 Tax=Rhodobacter sp. Har01 TaxID=2883999 RepID=UPI001D071BB3|nr:metallophosphoesterase family protein [Rhodobacter sp. Har01]MCB6177717.1 serine/threonine protein phosphatase [Rhodobacter sp. Har01]